MGTAARGVVRNVGSYEQDDLFLPGSVSVPVSLIVSRFRMKESPDVSSDLINFRRRSGVGGVDYLVPSFFRRS